MRRPEVNILITNHTDTAAPFSLSMIEPVNENRPPCQRRIEPLPEIGHEQWTLLDERDVPESLGTIPPRGWAHRAVILTGPYFRPPCEYHYRLRIVDDKGERAIDGVVRVPETPPRAPPVTSEAPSLVAEVMVERDLFQRHLLLRLLVRNNADHAERVWISDRTLNCPSGTRVDWSTERPVPQGHDIGPSFIGPGDWAVLVSAVRILQGESAEKCRGTMAISRRTVSGWLRWQTVRFKLVPTGFLKLPEFVDPL